MAGATMGCEGVESARGALEDGHGGLVTEEYRSEGK